MTKVITKLMNKICEMEFPSFYVYDFISNDKELMPLNNSHNFLWYLATDIHYHTLETTLEEAILSACSYAYWSKCEYEHWVDGNKIKEDGYYEQFIRWAYDDENLDWYSCKDKEPIGLRTWLQNHALTKMWENARAKALKKIEKEKGGK